jgi:hypothetical protein
VGEKPFNRIPDLLGTTEAHHRSLSLSNYWCWSQEVMASSGYCFFFSFGTTATGMVGVRALAREIRFLRFSDWLSTPLCFSASFNQSGMTIALINSCTVMSLSSAIFRSFV